MQEEAETIPSIFVFVGGACGQGAQLRVEICGVGQEVAGDRPVGPWAGYVRVLDSGLNGGVVTPFRCREPVRRTATRSMSVGVIWTSDRSLGAEPLVVRGGDT